MWDTWYVLEDDSLVDPNEVAPDKSGALRHKDGRAVKMRGAVPHSHGVDPDEERAKAKAKTAPPVTTHKDMKPEEPVHPYRTRDMVPTVSTESPVPAHPPAPAPKSDRR